MKSHCKFQDAAQVESVRFLLLWIDSVTLQMEIVLIFFATINESMSKMNALFQVKQIDASIQY